MNRIRYYREKNGLTMTELAEKVGITPGSLSNYELGKREPKYELLIKIAKALYTDVNHLLGTVDDDADEPAPEKPVKQEIRDPYEQEAELIEYLEELRRRPEMKMLFDCSRHMTVEQVRNLVTMIEGFAGKNQD